MNNEEINIREFTPANAHDLAPRGEIASIRSDQVAVKILPQQQIGLNVPQVLGRNAWELKLAGPILINPQPEWYPSGVQTLDFFLTKLKNVVCLPGAVALKDNHVLLHSFEAWIHWSNSALDQPSPGKFKVKQKEEEPIFLPGNYIYLDRQHLPHPDHFILNVLSMLWAWDMLKNLLFQPPKLLVSPHLSEQQIGVLRGLGIDRDLIVKVDRTLCPENVFFATPGFVQDGYTSSLAWGVWKSVSARYEGGSSPEKIYISRSRAPKIADSRTLLNEPDVEKIFKAHGFKIVHPELLSIQDQIKWFAGAQFIAGQAGEGMANLAFQSHLKSALVLSSPNFMKLQNTLLQAPHPSGLIEFFGHALKREQHSDWLVDPDVLSNVIYDWLATKDHKPVSAQDKIHHLPFAPTSLIENKEGITNKNSESGGTKKDLVSTQAEHGNVDLTQEELKQSPSNMPGIQALIEDLFLSNSLSDKQDDFSDLLFYPKTQEPSVAKTGRKKSSQPSKEPGREPGKKELGTTDGEASKPKPTIKRTSVKKVDK